MSDDVDELAAEIIKQATDEGLLSTILYKIARAYQEARREIERLQQGIAATNQAWDENLKAAESALAALREQAERDAKVIEAARYFDFGGDWGTRMAMITNGAATREEGIAHNKEIVRAQRKLSAALAARAKEPGHGS